MTIANVRPQIEAVIEGRSNCSVAAKAILESGWDFNDPTGKLMSSPKRVEDFLRENVIEIQMLDDMTVQRCGLFKMIMHAYCHALDKQYASRS